MVVVVHKLDVSQYPTGVFRNSDVALLRKILDYRMWQPCGWLEKLRVTCRSVLF
jgi:hypothetical protein